MEIGINQWLIGFEVTVYLSFPYCSDLKNLKAIEGRCVTAERHKLKWLNVTKFDKGLTKASANDALSLSFNCIEPMLDLSSGSVSPCIFVNVES